MCVSRTYFPVVAERRSGITMSVGFVLWRTDMTDIDVSTIELLGRLIGRRNAKRLYRDSLMPFFKPEAEEAHHVRLLAARELVRRWLEEDLRNGVELLNPSQVR